MDWSILKKINYPILIIAFITISFVMSIVECMVIFAGQIRDEPLMTINAFLICINVFRIYRIFIVHSIWSNWKFSNCVCCA